MCRGGYVVEQVDDVLISALRAESGETLDVRVQNGHVGVEIRSVDAAGQDGNIAWAPERLCTKLKMTIRKLIRCMYCVNLR